MSLLWFYAFNIDINTDFIDAVSTTFSNKVITTLVLL